MNDNNNGNEMNEAGTMEKAVEMANETVMPEPWEVSGSAEMPEPETMSSELQMPGETNTEERLSNQAPRTEAVDETQQEIVVEITIRVPGDVKVSQSSPDQTTP